MQGTNTYILTVIDIGAKYFWIVPMERKTGAEFIKVLKSYKSHKGGFERICADAGTEILSDELKTWCVKNNIHIDNFPPEGQN